MILYHYFHLLAIWKASAECEQKRKNEEASARQIVERKQEELFAFKALLADALRWKQSIIFKEYIEAIKAKRAKEGTQNISHDWIRWAEAKVAWYDAMIESTDQFLDDVDKNSLLTTDIKFNL